MSATVCETHSQPLPAPTSQGCYHWPSPSSPSESSKSNTIRIVSSQTISLPGPSAPSMKSSNPAVRSSKDAPPSSTAWTADAPREPARQHGEPKSALPFPRPPRAPHCRSMSLTEPQASTSSNADPGPGPAGSRPRTNASTRPHTRARAASSATTGGHEPRPRPRLPSMLASVLTLRKAPPELRKAPTDGELVGSFAPTSSPRPRLQSLLSLAGPPPSPRGAVSSGSMSVPTSPELAFAAPLAYATLRRPRVQSEAQRSTVPPTSFSRRRKSHRHHSHDDDGEPPRSPGLPSICRTPSSYSGSGSDGYFPTAPSSAGPATPVLPPSHTLPRAPLGKPPVVVAADGTATPSLHPVLAGLERTSMFRVKTACATCGERGSNFPCCPKCGEMWCSRACRLKKGDGKRHMCAVKPAAVSEGQSQPQPEHTADRVS